MKFIVIGLGHFGASLAEKLTQLGHEVIGVDKQSEKTEAIKDKITQAICLDCKYQEAVMHLPLKNTDVVVVSIGEDEGSNILTTALMKKMDVPRIISRSVSPLHETVLEAMEVNEIVRPEEETAERWAMKLSSPTIVEAFQLTNKYSVVEARVPDHFAGKTVQQIGFIKNFNVIVLTIMKEKTARNLLGLYRKVSRLEIEGVANADTLIEKDDIMVLYGENSNIKRLLEQK